MNGTPVPGPGPVGYCAPEIPGGIAALVFDFDGTLADTTPGHEQALRTALQPYGLHLDHDWYRRHVGLSIQDLLAALPGGSSLPHESVIRSSRTQLLAAVGRITPLPCVVALLRTARRAGLPCAVASGASRLLVRPGIDALDLAGEFAAVVTREDVARGKPAPDLYLAAARQLGFAPGRCLAVDDAPDGIASARAAAMPVITVKDGHLAPVGITTAPPGGGASACDRGTPAAARAPDAPPHASLPPRPGPAQPPPLR
ncbi:HAD family hydrolase [Streptomyces alboflavus]|nr:HAD family phosphatase [Streptomyces alboflavus]